VSAARALALAAFLAFGAAGSAALAAAPDRPIALTLDHRPVATNPDVALVHDGIVYVDIVPLTRAFQGSLHRTATTATARITDYVGRFTLGSTTLHLAHGTFTMAGPPFVRNGKFYVPLNAYVVKFARQRMFVNLSQTKANIFVNSDPEDF